jgi:hypothetical protein
MSTALTDSSNSSIGRRNSKPPFFCPSNIAGAQELSIAFLFNEKRGVASAGLGRAVVGRSEAAWGQILDFEILLPRGESVGVSGNCFL